MNFQRVETRKINKNEDYKIHRKGKEKVYEIFSTIKSKYDEKIKANLFSVRKTFNYFLKKRKMNKKSPACLFRLYCLQNGLRGVEKRDLWKEWIKFQTKLSQFKKR